MSTAHDFQVVVKRDGGSVTINVIGELDVATVRVLGSHLDDAIERGDRHVVIDLTAMTCIDSSGLGLLVGAHRRFQDQSGTMTVRGLQATALEAFRITGLLDMLDIEDAERHI